MAQDVPTIAQLFGINEAGLTRFKEMLPPRDQQALAALFDMTNSHPIANALAAAPKELAEELPVEFLFLAVLLEHHKTLTFIIEQQSVYTQRLYLNRVKKTGR